jgi:hypothetical protein
MKEIERIIPMDAKTWLQDPDTVLLTQNNVIAITKDGVAAAMRFTTDRFGGLLDTIAISSDWADTAR